MNSSRRALTIAIAAGLAVPFALAAQSAGPSRSALGQPPVKKPRKSRSDKNTDKAPAKEEAVKPAAPGSNQALLDDLSLAYRILARTGIVDAYGHVSVRNPVNPSHYYLQRNLPPALSTPADLVEYDLDSKPVDANAPTGFIERYIHGEIYRQRPDVMAIVHFHAQEVIPFGVSGVPLRPIYHMAGFLGEGVPLFEIRDSGGMTDMLIRSPELGQALAKTLGDKPVALLRGHGAVAVASSLHIAVGRAYYMAMNARLQAQAMQMGPNIVYLSQEEARKTGSQDGFERAWTLWKSEAALPQAKR
jgi:ribulose-5-phosphate 4-epimerase/fuculose-1-phosphate aldolase